MSGVPEIHKYLGRVPLGLDKGKSRCRFAPPVTTSETDASVWEDSLAMGLQLPSIAPSEQDTGAFVHSLVNGLVKAPISTEEDRGRILEALGHAMGAFNAWATKALWDKFAAESGNVSRLSMDKWDIYGRDNKWPNVTYELVTFLALTVQRPVLLEAVVQPRLSWANGSITHADGCKLSTEGLGKLRKGAPAIIAAILSDLYFAGRSTKGFEHDLAQNTERWNQLVKEDPCLNMDREPVPPVDKCWLDALRLLCRLMPCDGLLRFVYKGSGVESSRTKACDACVLHVAVACSEWTTGPLLTLLEHGRWTHFQLLRAFTFAAKPQQLRGGTFVNVVVALYRALITSHIARVPMGIASAEQALQKDVKSAWLAVTRDASWYSEVDVIGLSQPMVQVPEVIPHSGAKQRDTIVFRDLAKQMFNVHIHEARQNGHDDNAHIMMDILATGLKEAIVAELLNPYEACKHPYLVIDYVGFLDSMGDLSLADLSWGCRHNVLSAAGSMRTPEFCQVLSYFVNDKGAFESRKFDQGYKTLLTMLSERAASFDNCWVLIEALTAHPRMLREAMEADTDVLSRDILPLYIRRFGAPLMVPKDNVPGTIRNTILTLCKERLERFLGLATWTDKQIGKAMKEAANVRSAVAVQVLMAPPYNANILPDSTTWLQTVFDAVLAPNEPLALAACDQLRKRARADGEQQE